MAGLVTRGLGTGQRLLTRGLGPSLSNIAREVMALISKIYISAISGSKKALMSLTSDIDLRRD